MQYLVHMRVNVPASVDHSTFDELKERERDLAQSLQHDGRWQHLWRVAGQYANYSVFDVSSHDELHELLTGLPLYPFMDIEVTPLAQHPSAI